MSMPIQRQSEAYGIFDDGPRFARDRSSADLPSGLAALINTSGPRITGGMLNTRQGGFPIDGPGDIPGPRDHGGAGPDGGRSVPDWYYDDDNDNDGDPPDKNFVSEDPWGHHASRRPFDRAAARRLTAFDWKQIPEEHLGDSSAKDQWHAPLENGHALWVYGHGDQPWGSFGGTSGYIAALDNLPYDPDFPEDASGENNWLYHVRDENSGKLKNFPTREHAMRAAEEAYQKHFPIGTDTGGHDSGTDYSDLNSYLRHLESSRTAAPTDWSGVRPGPLVDGPMREQDPDDYFGWRPYSGPMCETCGRPARAVSGPHCRHAQLSYEDVMAHIDEQLATGEPEDRSDYSTDYYDEPVRGDVVDSEWQKNIPRPVPWRQQPVQHLHPVYKINNCPKCGDRIESRVVKQNGYGVWSCASGHGDSIRADGSHPSIQARVAADAAVMDPAQMQVPMGGGYQPAHRVGLPWRGQVIPGTVINLEGPNVNVRWDDGQYSTEEPHNIQLL
jgi:hypothetical protein